MFHNITVVRRKRIEIIVIAILIIGLIGYAGAGIVYSAVRVASAERTLNTVISHQNTLNSTFSDINTQLGSLSSSSAFNPQQAIVLVDRSVANSELATQTINQDDVSLSTAATQLQDNAWLTVVGRGSLDREAKRIGHARNALAAARTIASDEGLDGHFWHALYTGLADLTTLNTQSGAGDLTTAKSTLGTMKTDIDQATQLSTSPGLPAELHDLMADLQTFIGDYGKQLDAQLAGDDASVAAYQAAVVADLAKIGKYDIDKIGREIDAFYKPLIDRFNTEIAAAAG
jgi:hypothetical protein